MISHPSAWKGRLFFKLWHKSLALPPEPEGKVREEKKIRVHGTLDQPPSLWLGEDPNDRALKWDREKRNYDLSELNSTPDEILKTIRS